VFDCAIVDDNFYFVIRSGSSRWPKE
jgi:hypothetical protein